MPQVHATPLTAKQQKFISAYLADPDRKGTKAAELAGYGAPHVAATRLLRHAKVIAAIREATARADNAVILNVEQRKQKLSEIVEKGDDHNKIKAIDVLNKMEPVYINRTEMSFEGMDSAKLNAESAEIMKLEGWVCFPPNHPRVQEARELLE